MGNCLNLRDIFNNPLNYEKIFLDYNIIDKENNIIIGIYYNYDKITKSNTSINQGICIGNNNIIHKIKFGIIHPYENKIVELYFENDIKLCFIMKTNNQILMKLKINDTLLEKYLDINNLKKYKQFNNNSDYIDLIYNLIF